MPLDGADEESWFPADTLLKDEMNKESHLRIAVSFAFMSNGQVIELDDEIVRCNLYEDIELVAAVSSGLGRQGMFSQAVWFGEGGASWKWMRISDIQFIVCPDDSLFRLGTEPCVVVGTESGPYFLTIPHPDYQDAWKRSLKAVWPTKKVDVKVWPFGGRRPVWWFDDYKDDWPFDKSEDDESCDEDERVLYLKDILGPGGIEP